MSHEFDDFAENNLIDICLEENFKDLNCILGTSEIIISIILILCTALGFIKMVKYYGTMNFETSLLLLTIIQIILLDIIVIIAHDLLFECFFFIQIIDISLTIRKFIILTKNSKSAFLENFTFIMINIVNIIIFILYILSSLGLLYSDEHKSNFIYSIIQSSNRIFYFIISITLSYLCRCAIKKLKVFEEKNQKFELNLKNKESTGNKSTKLMVSFNNNEWLFFTIRERQITPLYIINLICSFLQMIFILSKHYLLVNFFERNKKIKILKSEGYFIYYFYLVICYVNALINYFCYYYTVKDQYEEEVSKKHKKKKKNNLLSDDDVIRETIHNNEDEKEISIILEDEKVNKKKFYKSLYSNTFTEESDKEKEDNYFKKNEEENKEEVEDEKKVELVDRSNEENSNRLTIASNNPINQSTENKSLFNFEKDQKPEN